MYKWLIMSYFLSRTFICNNNVIRTNSYMKKGNSERNLNTKQLASQQLHQSNFIFQSSHHFNGLFWSVLCFQPTSTIRAGVHLLFIMKTNKVCLNCLLIHNEMLQLQDYYLNEHFVKTLGRSSYWHLKLNEISILAFINNTFHLRIMQIPWILFPELIQVDVNYTLVWASIGYIKRSSLFHRDIRWFTSTRKHFGH